MWDFVPKTRFIAYSKYSAAEPGDFVIPLYRGSVVQRVCRNAIRDVDQSVIMMNCL